MIQVFLELVERDFVAGLVPPVVLGVLLDGVVGQMHVSACAFYIELFGACSNVAFFVPPGLPTAPQNPNSNIEFPTVV